MFDLAGEGNLLALTVDDGGDADVVGAYARWIAETGMRSFRMGAAAAMSYVLAVVLLLVSLLNFRLFRMQREDS